MRKIDPARVAQQRDEIVQAAMRCFASRGVQASTTDEICREAGISPGRLYYYFPSKEQVVEAVARDLNADFWLDLPDALSEGDLPTSIRRHHVRLKTRLEGRGVSTALLMELFSQSERSPAVRAAVQEGAARRLAGLREAIERHRRMGALRQGADTEDLALGVAAIFSGIEVLALTDPDYDLERYYRAAEALLRPWFRSRPGD